MPFLRRNAALVSVAAAAFAGGLVVAAGLDWTRPTQAAVLQLPSQREVRPVAELSQAFITIAEAVTPAVVSIEAEKSPRADAGRARRMREMRELFPYLNPEDGDAPQSISGSGFVIRADGYIVTNNHVVADADRITVVMGDNRQLPATVVGRDPNTDIAVIRVQATGLPTVRVGRSEDARIGEWVLAIGNPLDLGTTVTSGIVSAKGRGLNGLLNQTAGNSPWAIEDFIQTDAPINPGNSGGPLVNLRGEVVGVNSAIASPTGFYSGYGFAVPIDLAQRVADDLIQFGKVRRPALGVRVTEVTPEDAEAFRLSRISGVVAQDFPAESPAREAGLRMGDVIVAVNGVAVQRVGQFQRLIASARPGDRVKVDLVRYGQARSIQVALGEAPADPVRTAAAPAAPLPAGTGRLGISLAPLTAESAKQQGFRDRRGLLVTGAVPYGAAYRAGVRRNMRVISVDGTAVNDADAFRRALDRKRAGQVVTLTVDFAGGQQGIFNVRVPADR
jgi:serine protease Do